MKDNNNCRSICFTGQTPDPSGHAHSLQTNVRVRFEYTHKLVLSTYEGVFSINKIDHYY